MSSFGSESDNGSNLAGMITGLITGTTSSTGAGRASSAISTLPAATSVRRALAGAASAADEVAFVGAFIAIQSSTGSAVIFVDWNALLAPIRASFPCSASFA